MIALIMFALLWLAVVIGGWLWMVYFIPHPHMFAGLESSGPWVDTISHRSM